MIDYDYYCIKNDDGTIDLFCETILTTIRIKEKFMTDTIENVQSYWATWIGGPMIFKYRDS